MVLDLPNTVTLYLTQWFSAFLMLQSFNTVALNFPNAVTLSTVPHVVVTLLFCYCYVNTCFPKVLEDSCERVISTPKGVTTHRLRAAALGCS